jgi:hypothetical protein
MTTQSFAFDNNTCAVDNQVAVAPRVYRGLSGCIRQAKVLLLHLMMETLLRGCVAKVVSSSRACCGVTRCDGKHIRSPRGDQWPLSTSTILACSKYQAV